MENKGKTDNRSFRAGALIARAALAATLGSECVVAQEPNLPDLWAQQPGPSYLLAAAINQSTQGEARPLPPSPLWDKGEGRSYWIPALEIIGFDLLLNQFNRNFLPEPNYNTTPSSIWRNITHGWVFDNDPYRVNQIGHPYQGSMYHGFARSAGLDFWPSFAYTFAGSIFWEWFGETTKPSKNDQVASGIGGVFLGEPLFRMANLLLEKGTVSRPWREFGAAVLSPATGFNRLAFGERFDEIFPSRDPAYFWRVQAGGGIDALTKRGTSNDPERNSLLLDYSMDYGLPGKSGYTYSRPFDYFSFQVTFTTANVVDNVLTRGSLVTKEYENTNTRGIWGLFGSFDYIAPQLFRISSTAVSVGQVGQTWLSENTALQHAALLGVGYGAAGTIRGAGDRDYHYGVTPQALVALRLIFGGRAMIDLTARDYFVSDVLSPEDRGTENIARLEAGYTLRFHKQHALAVRYTWAHRHADYPDLGERTQSRGIVGLFYTYLGGDNFGAVEWRK